jgi:hypothetical protein
MQRDIHNVINPLNAELNPICHLLALLAAQPIFHVSRIWVNVEKLDLYVEETNTTVNEVLKTYNYL